MTKPRSDILVAGGVAPEIKSTKIDASAAFVKTTNDVCIEISEGSLMTDKNNVLQT